jgi:uncharacterized membrane protein
MTDEARFEALNDAVREILRRQADLEERLSRLEIAKGSVLPSSAPVPTTQPPGVPPVAHPAATPKRDADTIRTRPVQASAVERPAIETKVGLTVINRVGVITLVLGIAFFFKWAVDNEWIGPTGRVVLGLLAGCAALGAADLLFRKAQKTFAQGIGGAGLAILYLAAYAAFGFYHLVPQAVAFAFLVSTTALAFALSLRYESAAIAALGLFGGYLTPLLLSTGEDHPWFLLSYVLLLDVAAMGLRRRKAWRVLEILAFAATTIIYFAWFEQHEVDHQKTAVATLGALAYYVLFAYAGSGMLAGLSSLVAAVEILFVWPDEPGPFFAFELLLAACGMFVALQRRAPNTLTLTFTAFWMCAAFFTLQNTGSGIGARFIGLSLGFLLLFAFAALSERTATESSALSMARLSIVAANGCVYFGLVYALLRTNYHQWLGFIAVCVAATYLALAAFIRRSTSVAAEVDLTKLTLPIGMALVFVTLSIPIQLSGFRITVAWALQAAALSWLGAKFRAQRAYMASIALFVLVAMRLLYVDAEVYAFTSTAPTLFLNSRFLAFAVSAGCAFVAATWTVSSSRALALAEYLGAHVALLIGLTLETVMWVGRNAAVSNRISAQTFAVSVLYGIYAVLLVSIGVTRRTAVNRVSGLVLIGFVIIKLYLFDVWQLDRVYRIAAFVALGILLISTSFLYSRYRHVLEALLRSDETSA